MQQEPGVCEYIFFLYLDYCLLNGSSGFFEERCDIQHVAWQMLESVQNGGTEMSGMAIINATEQDSRTAGRSG